MNIHETPRRCYRVFDRLKGKHVGTVIEWVETGRYQGVPRDLTTLKMELGL